MQAICGKYDRSVMFANLENDGIAKPLNVMMKIAFETGADYVVTMSNDMLEQEGWIVQMALAAMQLQKVGIVSIPPTDPTVTRYERKEENGFTIEEGDLIGNFLITRALWEKIGGFSEEYGNYGPIDIDYCMRARIAGFRTIYLSNFKTNHLGYNQDPSYKKPKMELLAKAWPKFWANCAGYRSGRKNIKQ
jgi:GT2 family glycosyltransferase